MPGSIIILTRKRKQWVWSIITKGFDRPVFSLSNNLVTFINCNWQMTIKRCLISFIYATLKYIRSFLARTYIQNYNLTSLSEVCRSFGAHQKKDRRREDWRESQIILSYWMKGWNPSISRVVDSMSHFQVRAGCGLQCSLEPWSEIRATGGPLNTPSVSTHTKSWLKKVYRKAGISQRNITVGMLTVWQIMISNRTDVMWTCESHEVSGAFHNVKCRTRVKVSLI